MSKKVNKVTERAVSEVETFELSLKSAHKFSVYSIHNARANQQGYQDGSYAPRNKHSSIDIN